MIYIYRVGRNLVTDHAGGGGVVPTAGNLTQYEKLNCFKIHTG